MTLIPITNGLQLAIIDNYEELAPHLRFCSTNGQFYCPTNSVGSLGCNTCGKLHPDIAAVCDSTDGRFMPAITPYLTPYYPEFFI